MRRLDDSFRSVPDGPTDGVGVLTLVVVLAWPNSAELIGCAGRWFGCFGRCAGRWFGCLADALVAGSAVWPMRWSLADALRRLWP